MKYVKIGLIVVVLVALIELGVYSFSRAKGEKDFLLYGNVDVRQVDISFRVPGKVEGVFFQEGDFVKKGDLMAVIDPIPYENLVLLAAAKVRSVVAKLELAKIFVADRLAVISSHAVSQENLDESAANYEALKAELSAQEAELALAQDALSYTQVEAPNDGIIFTRILEPGSVVNVGQAVYTLSLLSPVWVRAYVDEPDLGKITLGMPVRVYTDTKGGKVYDGKVGFVSPMAEFTPKTVETPSLRTALVYRVRIYIDNPDLALKQGMPVTVKVL